MYQILSDIKNNVHNMNLSDNQTQREVARNLAQLDQKIQPFIGAKMNSDRLQK